MNECYDYITLIIMYLTDTFIQNDGDSKDTFDELMRLCRRDML